MKNYIMIKNFLIKGDLINSMKTIKEKDDLIAEKSKQFEGILQEYKNKIENLMNINGNLLKKIKDIDTTCTILKNKNDIYKLSLVEKEKMMQEFGRDKSKTILNHQVKTLIGMILNLKKNIVEEKFAKITEKFKNILIDE